MEPLDLSVLLLALAAACSPLPDLSAWDACVMHDASLVEDPSLSSWKPGPGDGVVVLAQRRSRGWPLLQDTSRTRLLAIELPASLSPGPVVPVRSLYREAGLTVSYEARELTGTVKATEAAGTLTLDVDLSATLPTKGTGTRLLSGTLHATIPCTDMKTG